MELSLAALGNIKVTTVSKEPEKVWRTPDPVYVLTQEDIRRSGATTIPDVLRLVPGVEVAQIDSDQWAVGIRGFGNQFSQGVLVLIDGRSVYTPLFGGVYWELQNLPLDEIDRIEVIRGPGGAVWGSNAVDGVINIITKKAKDTHGTHLSMGGGNVNQAATEFGYGAGNGRGFDYRVYGMGFDNGPELHQDHDPFDAWRTGQAGFRADWDTGHSDAFTLQGDIYDGYDGARAGIAYYSPPSQVSVDGAAKVAGGNLLGNWRRKLGDGSDMELQAYFDRTTRLEPQYGEDRNTFDVDFHHHLRLPHGQDFIWGIGADISPSTFIQTVATLNLVPSHQTDALYSGFVQDQIPIVQDRLWLTLGSKLLHDNYTGFEIEPSARLLWTPGPHQTLWAGLTRAVSTPSDLQENVQFAELFEATPPTFLQLAGNRNLSSTTLVSHELGYRTLIRPRLYLDLTAFYNKYNYLIGVGTPSVSGLRPPPPSHTLITYMDVNGLMGHTTGFEVGPHWRVSPWWELKGSYSYLSMNIRTRPGNTDTQAALAGEESSPRHQVVIQSLFDLPRKFQFDPTYRYVSALPYLSVPAYSTADVRLGWHPNPHLEFSLTGENLLQPGHIEFVSDPGPPVEIRRSVYGKITFRW